MMTPGATYCLDTSFLINGWWLYDINVFPGLWDHLDIAIYHESHPIFACIEVFHDLSKQKDGLYHWAKMRKDPLFRDATPGVTRAMSEIMNKFPNFAAIGGSTNASDPWVIAHAKSSGAIVVTDEASNPKGKPTKPPKIPDVCDALGVSWLRPIDFLKAIGVKLERPSSS